MVDERGTSHIVDAFVCSTKDCQFKQDVEELTIVLADRFSKFTKDLTTTEKNRIRAALREMKIMI